MRRLVCFLAFSLLLCLALPAPGEGARPQFRPAVFAVGPDALVNRINVKELLSKGQKDGAVQFGAVVEPNGKGSDFWISHPMPGSDLLAKEVLARLEGAKFTAPIYNHQPVRVVLYGTAVFSADDTTHLRIFLNQDPGELKNASDFIGPQPVIGADSPFTGFNPPKTVPVSIEGVVEIRVHVNEKGVLQGMAVTGEDPPLLGFRDSALSDLEGAKFIPAFRDGDATDSESTFSAYYRPINVDPE